MLHGNFFITMIMNYVPSTLLCDNLRHSSLLQVTFQQLETILHLAFMQTMTHLNVTSLFLLWCDTVCTDGKNKVRGDSRENPSWMDIHSYLGGYQLNSTLVRISSYASSLSLLSSPYPLFHINSSSFPWVRWLEFIVSRCWRNCVRELNLRKLFS